MKKTRFLTLSIVSFILLFSLAVPALAAPDTPPLPSSFYGEIHFQADDAPVPTITSMLMWRV